MTFDKKSVSGKTLIVVDIQPEYKRWMPARLTSHVIMYINEKFDELKSVLFLYNGEELGMISEGDYKDWLIENGLDEEILNHCKFFDKGYAFFRNAIDGGLDDDAIIALVQYMMKNNIYDSRDMTASDWKSYLKEKDADEHVLEFVKDNEDAVFIPDVVNILKPINNILLCGGGVNECLKEIEFVLKALKKPYELIKRYTY